MINPNPNATYLIWMFKSSTELNGVGMISIINMILIETQSTFILLPKTHYPIINHYQAKVFTSLNEFNLNVSIALLYK